MGFSILSDFVMFFLPFRFAIRLLTLPRLLTSYKSSKPFAGFQISTSFISRLLSLQFVLLDCDIKSVIVQLLCVVLRLGFVSKNLARCEIPVVGVIASLAYGINFHFSSFLSKWQVVGIGADGRQGVEPHLHGCRLRLRLRLRCRLRLLESPRLGVGGPAFPSVAVGVGPGL